MKSKRRFWRAALIYAIVVIIIILIGAVLLWKYMAAYEASRPVNVIKSYVLSLDEDRVNTLTELSMGDVNTELEDISGVQKTVYDMIKAASPTKDSAASDESRQVYYLVNDGTAVESVTIERTGNGKYGLAEWTVTDEEIIYAAEKLSASIAVPEGYTVECNGVALDESYITDRAVEYELLSAFYDISDYKLPYLVKYQVDNCISEPVFTVIDAAGKTLTGDETNEEHYLQDCSTAEAEAVTEFATEFVTHYVGYTSTGDWGEYYQVLAMCIHHGQLYTAIAESREGFSHATSKGDDIQYINVDGAAKLSDGLYAVRVSYEVVTTGSNKVVTTNDYGMRLLIEQNEDGTLQAGAMTIAE